VVAQVALLLVLLISAGLSLKTLHRVASIDAGFNASHVLLAGVDLLPNSYTAERGEIAIRQMSASIAGAARRGCGEHHA